MELCVEKFICLFCVLQKILSESVEQIYDNCLILNILLLFKNSADFQLCFQNWQTWFKFWISLTGDKLTHCLHFCYTCKNTKCAAINKFLLVKKKKKERKETG